MIDYALLSLKSLSHRKFRTFLTLLGVIIGIAAVVSMISIGTGMKVSLEEQLEVLGTDKLIVSTPQVLGGRTKELTDADADAIDGVMGVSLVSSLYSVSTNVKFRGEEKTGTVWGLDPEKAEKTFAGTSGYDLLEGRWIGKGDKNKITVGYGIHDDFFEREVSVGNALYIKEHPFQVVGIFKQTGDRDSDYAIYADIDQLRQLMGKEKEITIVIVRIKEGSNIEQVAMRIEDVLEKRLGEKNFVVLTPKQIVEQVGETFKIIQIVFGGIAAVSLAVGGIGIANTMVMNVLERTVEIGIMKSVGASREHILRIFLFESGMIGAVGGSIGVLFGYAISKAINIAASKYLGQGILYTTVTPEMALSALAFAFVVGIISGIYPAYKASELDPVEALRRGA
ncbi:MAG: ABC transporter permease [Euryarchaeota archaeon]|nr:ABC transporter permease [Euryarchaeota archaeon]